MATAVVTFAKSDAIRSVLQNSTAVALSRPRVLLSQHCSGESANSTSAIETRLRLPWSSVHQQ